MMKTTQADNDKQTCWREIGIWSPGSPTCPELENYIHCRNCPVYQKSGQQLFARPAPDGYLEAWTQALVAANEERDRDLRSVIVFRVGKEIFSLSTEAVKSITHPQSIHRIPHRTNEVFLGLTNIEGTFHLCFSMRDLLEVEDFNRERESDRFVYKRMVVIGKGETSWGFHADEILGIHHYPSRSLQPLPATVTKASAHYTLGLIPWDSDDALEHEGQDPEVRQVGLIDENAVLRTLEGRIK